MSWTDADVVEEAWSEADVAPEPVSAPRRPNLFKAALAAGPASLLLDKMGGRGPAEAALEMGTGMVGQAAGGIRGLYGLATGDDHEEATRKIRETQEALTYRPRSGEGELASKIVSYPLEKLSQATGAAGEFIGGDAGRSIGEVVPAVAATLYGGRGAMQATKPKPVTESMVRAAEEARAALGPKLEAAEAARKHGIVIDPTEVNPTRGNRLVKSLAGGDEVTGVLAKANEAQWSKPLKKELGMDENAPITMKALEKVREDAALPSGEIAKIGNLAADAEFGQALEALRPRQGLIGGRAAFNKQNARIAETQRMLATDVPAAQLLENISQLRKEARDIYKMPDAGRAKLAVADTSKGIADAMESLVERRVMATGDATLVDRFRKGRETMAKTYALEKATDFNTGQVVPSKLASMTAKDNPLTGAFADIGKVAGVFPELARPQAAVPSFMQQHFARNTLPALGGGLIGTMISPGMGSLAGAAAGGILSSAVRNVAGKRISSPGYQARNALPPPAPTMPAAPLSLAPVGQPIQQPRQVGPTIEPRPTLELLPKDAEITSSALRGARTPMGKGPVEFTPGGGQDFMLRQEGLQQPAMVSAINNFRAKAADLESKIANSQGFWKQRYQAELDALKAEFGAGMEMFGVRSPQEAIGLQPLYEGQAQGRLPVQKTFDPRAEALRRK